MEKEPAPKFSQALESEWDEINLIRRFKEDPFLRTKIWIVFQLLSKKEDKSIFAGEEKEKFDQFGAMLLVGKNKNDNAIPLQSLAVYVLAMRSMLDSKGVNRGIVNLEHIEAEAERFDREWAAEYGKDEKYEPFSAIGNYIKGIERLSPRERADLLEDTKGGFGGRSEYKRMFEQFPDLIRALERFNRWATKVEKEEKLKEDLQHLKGGD